MKESTQRNYFGEFVDEYADEIVGIQPQFYKNAGAKINRTLRGFEQAKILDIGNGGVINYNFSELKELWCVDLEISEKAVEKYAKYPMVRFKKGNIFTLEGMEDQYFDAIIIQTVIHHLAGNSVEESERNVIEALESCRRVLKKGGKILIVESVVSPWFDGLERLFYTPMQFFFKLVQFDRVYQFSKKHLYRVLSEAWNITEFEDVGMDKYIWLLRKKILTKITPCRASWYLLEERQNGQN